MRSLDNFPPYTLRKSIKARHLQLKITYQGELEIIVPRRVSEKAALDFLKINYEWVAKRKHLIQGSPKTLDEWPGEIYFPSIHRRWNLQFQLSPRKKIIETEKELLILLPEFSTVFALNLLKKWLKQKAETYLTPWLLRLSTDCGLSFESVTYRGLKSQWGNCKHKTQICLNYKLLFLPNEYVQYVLIHELCHTVHFNHSSAFWNLVDRFVPNWQELRYKTRRANEFLPKWLG